LNAIAPSLDSFLLSYIDLELVASVYATYEVKLPNFCKVEVAVSPNAPDKESI
jgi:hypothetical protein